MSDLIWHNEKRKINELIPYEQNPRQMTEKQVEDLKKSLEKFNLVEIPAIDTDNKIIAGHQRLKILQMIGRGDNEIDVRVPNRKLTDEEFKEYNIRSNKNTGEWDWDILNSFDQDILLEAGFSNEDLVVGFGLNKAETQEVDLERLNVLTVFPPEAPQLKDRVELHFDNYEDYKKVKDAFNDGKLTIEKIILSIL